MPRCEERAALAGARRGSEGGCPPPVGGLSMTEKSAEGVDPPQAEARSVDLTVPAHGRMRAVTAA